MIRTRNKRDINVGVQPVVQNVKHNGEICIISENPKIRGDMTNLKKLLIPNIKSNVKLAISNSLQQGAYLSYSGVDSINMHFAGIPIHTHFIELVLIPKPKTNTRYDLCISLGIKDVLLKAMNDVLISMAANESCVLTRKILADLDAEGGYKGDYFTFRMLTKERYLIDFNYEISQPQHKIQPFVEIRVLNDVKVSPFESDGIYFIPFGSVVQDIKFMSDSVGGPDWNYRLECLKECLSRTNTSLSYFAFQAMLRICFPAVTMIKMGVREGVESLITEAICNAPQNRGEALTALKSELFDEINKSNNMSELFKCVTFDNFIRRARILGLIPDPDMRTGDIISNAYNITTFEEFKKVNLK